MRHPRWVDAGLLGALTACAATPVRLEPSVVTSPQTPDAELRTPDAPFRAERPARERMPPYFPPRARSMTLANGMGLLVIERHATPLFAAELVSRGGRAAFPDETPAAFSIMADATLGGAATRSQADLFHAMNERSFELQPRAADDSLSFCMRGLSSSFDDALEVLRDVALRPQFTTVDVELRRKRYVGMALHALHEARSIAMRSLFASVYGPSHPYTLSIHTKPEALEKITRDDVVRVWRNAVEPTETTLIVAGDVDAEAVRAHAEALFGGWKHDPTRRLPAPMPAPIPSPPRLVVVNRPGAALATLFRGAALPPMDPAHQPVYSILGELAGWMRSSTVQTELSDANSGVWRGSARIDVHRGSSLLVWEGNVEPKKVASALAFLDARMGELRERGPSSDELAAAKTLLVRSIPQRVQTVNGLVAAFVPVALLGQPLDDLETRAQRIDAVTVADVRAVVPARAATTTVVVGDLAVLRGPLLSLGWGALEEHDENGAVVRTISR